MKKILYIVYYFPPYQMTYTFRVSRIARFLPDNGILPVVLTAYDGKHHWHEETLQEIDPRIEIHRVNNPINYTKKNSINLYKKTSKLTQAKNKLIMSIKDLILSPDSYLLWSIKIIPCAIKLIKKHNIKHVSFCLGPYSPALTGYFLKKLTDIDYSLDFRDEWIKVAQIDQSTHKRELKPETLFRKRLNKFWEKRCVNNASNVFSVTDTMTNNFLRTYPKQKNCFTIPNGFVKSDYKELNISQVPFRKDRITFYYVGSISINSDIYNPTKFLNGFVKFLKKTSITPELHIFGAVDEETKNFIDSYDINDYIIFHGRVERSELLKQLNKADVFLHFYYPDLHPEALSIKIFEYAYLCKPILSFSNRVGEMADFFQATQSGLICWGNNEDEIAELFEKVLTFPQQVLFTESRYRVLEKYNFERGVELMANKIKLSLENEGN
jgi:glycosyltransferase involved in cell wall biosynthesis